MEITKELAIKLLKQMMQIRQFEDMIMELLAKNIAEGGSHLYAGMEAVAVGAISVINPDDYITSTHRGHGHAIAKDGDLKALMAEILGKKTGVCKGKGGSLHLADLSKGNLGANGIVGGGLGIATGAGLSIKLQKQNKVVLCFFGDGATNNGIFFECLNMASLWKLPVVYICENNKYAMSVSVERSHAVKDITKKALAFDIPAENVDGQDVLAVREVVGKWVDYARQGNGPSFIVANTYRYYGHSRSDPRVYRTREEEKFWKERDPIIIFSNKMKEMGILTEEEINEIEEEVKKEIEEAVD
ncbi:MAG: thiamine pyrophosphate-dependent dehydrogenase E1 component subunit alpha, partial [bacterium]|nr:thiamine pyrophosphate-dependent dehydrogenase E1 component subunit alpha [bacterium]MDW8163809.1 thiamine pyrophosphate-dependent dehydrogenase E1 component subunit alpha [Candidatus Omnitrophota bacterium]